MKDIIFTSYHAPITGASHFEEGTDPETIKGHWCEDESPYYMTVPYQLRDRLISLLNAIIDERSKKDAVARRDSKKDKRPRK
jgi:hypothetical protein